ncbi:DUF6624 domain-containing protein [Chitinophaga rhizophila]|uniref:Uncharacterized protein n=1 Tax=Chitinophaga rhizophila TaxID=2866212 RepID=A0ABS7GL23_9BACT|nr:DUF6624 domain-containing protein [Chitinophaga rhizophila]MBW8687991.1 hypothetical protein [Chitinophaga rhizophila]
MKCYPACMVLLMLCLRTTAFCQHAPLSLEQKDAIIRILDTVSAADQQYRSQLEYVQSKHGGDSPEMKALFAKMAIADSLNLLKVTAIIDTFGWLGADDIGRSGNTTLFMVIQHAGIQAQDKYLPVMRAAAANGKAALRSLALLEDRVALYHGHRQVYGSQVIWDMKANHYQVAPLEDPAQVDKRRASMGLPTMAEYLAPFDMKWDAVQYARELPELEAGFFKKPAKN